MSVHKQKLRCDYILNIPRVRGVVRSALWCMCWCDVQCISYQQNTTNNINRGVVWWGGLRCVVMLISLLLFYGKTLKLFRALFTFTNVPRASDDSHQRAVYLSSAPQTRRRHMLSLRIYFIYYKWEAFSFSYTTHLYEKINTFPVHSVRYKWVLAYKHETAELIVYIRYTRQLWFNHIKFIEEMKMLNCSRRVSVPKKTKGK